jgi:hypothetical protein
MELLGDGDEKTLFLESANGLGAELHGDFFAVDHQRFGLEIWLPDFLGVALAEADITAKLLAFAGEITLLHN